MKYSKQISFFALATGVFLAVTTTAAPGDPNAPDKDSDKEKAPPVKKAQPHATQPGKYTPGSRPEGEPKKSTGHATEGFDSGERRKSPTTSSPSGESSTHHDSSITRHEETTRPTKTETEPKKPAGISPAHHEETTRPTKNTSERTTEHVTTTTTTKEVTRTTRAPVTLHTKTTSDGGHVKVTASGQVREKEVIKVDGAHTQHFAPTGRVQTEVIVRTDGAHETKHFAPNGKVEKTVIVKTGGVTEATSIRYGRDGHERVNETIVVEHGREVSKVVVVREPVLLVRNTTIVIGAPIERHYERARFGFVYHPMFEIRSPVFVSWYDPYWYSPAGVVVVHPFHYSWGWDAQPWYHRQHHYWANYEVYPTPSYWVTDWMIAGYAADHYAAAISVDQAREEARLAREDAEKARASAEIAQEQAEIAEAHAAQQAAEARAARAEAKIASLQAAEAQAAADKPSAHLAPIDPQTKEALRIQIEQTVAEKKAFAEQSAQGGKPVPPDVSIALTDPKHIYPISSSINVISAVDQSPAGTLSEGDLLKLEPGQEEVIKTADENTFIKMRVLTSKGEDGEAQAGAVVSVPLKTVQDSDSEFRAKLDLGLAEADKNKDQFKGGTQ